MRYIRVHADFEEECYNENCELFHHYGFLSQLALDKLEAPSDDGIADTPAEE